MATDPNIILAGAQPAPQPFTLGSLSQMMQMKQQVQQQRMQNALLSITRQPGAFGDDGMPTANTLRQISGIDPQAGMQMAGQMATVRAREATQQKEALGAMQTRRKLAAGPSDAGVSAYYGAISSGATPQQAMQAGNDAYIKARSELAAGGDLGDALDTMVPKAFNLASAYGQAVTAKDAQANYQKNLADQRADAREGRMDRYQQAELGIQNARLGLEGARLAKQNEQDAAGAQAVGSLSDAAIDEAAERYRMFGVMPSFGMSKQSAALKVKIMQRAAQLDSGAGVSASDAAIKQSEGKANQQALGALQKQSAMVGNFEKTAMKNADLALSASEAMDRTGIPAFNKWLQAGKTATGSVEAAKFDAANNSFVEEYAKVMSGASGGGAAATDSARARAHEILNTSHTKEQYRANVDLLKKEMSNRTAALDEQREEIQSQMRGKSAGSSGKTLTYDPATGTFK